MDWLNNLMKTGLDVYKVKAGVDQQEKMLKTVEVPQQVGFQPYNVKNTPPAPAGDIDKKPYYIAAAGLGVVLVVLLVMRR